jgi:hypothetical protein
MADDTHGPISEELQGLMQYLAAGLDKAFNGELKGYDRKVAFVLLTANFAKPGEPAEGRTNYISNGKREDIVAMLKEVVARFEGRVDEPAGAVQ